MPPELHAFQHDEIAALLALAAEGSFVAAGRRLGRHPSIVSKRVAAFEQRLGVRLVERSTRQVRLTETGRELAERLRTAVEGIAAAEQQAALGAAKVQGTLRVSLPGAMGRLWLAPLLPEFLRRYPEVSVSAHYTDRYVDMIAEGFDVAIRIGELNDSRLIATRLCSNRRVLCASPAYLQQHGHPSQPTDLAQHDCLRFSGFSSFPEWHLTNGHRRESVLVNGPLTSNESESLREGMLAGLGILGAGEWLMSRDLRAGRVVRVLPEWQLDAPGAVYLLRPSRKFAAASTTAFKEWIEDKFSADPPWDQSAP